MGKIEDEISDDLNRIMVHLISSEKSSGDEKTGNIYQSDIRYGAQSI